MVPVFNNVKVYICNTDALKGSLVNTLQKARPTLSVAVHRLYEKMAESIQKVINEATGFKKSLFNWAMDIGYRTCMTRQYGQTVQKPWGYFLADKIVFQTIRKKLGFDKFDIPIYDLLGQSEGTAPFATNSYVGQVWKVRF